MKTLVVLVGIPGSGKTHYCEHELVGYTRVSQDDQGKAGHQKTFDAALESGDEFIVVDRVNHLRCQRRNFIVAAKRLGYHTKLVWFNVDRQLCLKRCKERKLHPTLSAADADKAIAMFVRIFQTPSRGEADELVIVGGRPPWVEVKDLAAEIGTRRHLIVGDLHGCLDELQDLLAERGFDPAEDVLIPVGDIMDRGPKVKEMADFLMGLPRCYPVLGNHDQKAVKFSEGKNVKPSHGLQGTIDAFGGKIPDAVVDWLRTFPLIIKTPSGYVVHGGFNPEMSPDEQTHADCIFMRYFGGASYFDSIGGSMWYKSWPKDAPRVFFGHMPDEAGYQTHNVVSLDGGCVFGGYLRAFDSKDGVVYYAQARRAYATSEWQQAVDGAASDVLRAREEYVVAGFLRKDETDDGELVIYTYTDQCTYDRAWDQVTINSRGHIFNKKTGECVARALKKFWNLGEHESVKADALPWDRPYTVTEKADGWLAILYRHVGKFKIASRGSFHSEGATWATGVIQQRDLSFLPDEVTVLFEMINKEQRIILDYGDMSTLIVLAAFNRHTGEEYPRETVDQWAIKMGLPIIKQYPNMTLADLLKFQQEGKGAEGFVVRFHDGLRVKVKCNWYMTRAKIMANLGPIAVWEAMKDGKVLREFLVGIPEELKPLADKIVVSLEDQYAMVLKKVMDYAVSMNDRFKGNKKAMALHMNQEKTQGILRTGTFCLAGHEMSAIDKAIMKLIYPKGGNLVSNNVLEIKSPCET